MENLQINEYIKSVEKKLNELLPKEDKFIDALYESMKYSLFAGGKRLRPILMIMAYNIFSSKSYANNVLEHACGIEMIHTYSLIHDDLPCMDNDDYRRGKLTNHKVYGEPEALLAGDALLNKAMEVMLSSCLKNREKIEIYTRATYEIMMAAGTCGMIGGQFVDMKSEGKKISNEILNFMHENKTGALIVAALRAGAIIGGACEEDLNNITEFGKSIGLAFQIQDDILDILGDEKELGKPVGSDEKNGKSTYVSLNGLEHSKAKVSELTEYAIEKIGYLEKSDELIELAKYMVNRKK